MLGHGGTGSASFLTDGFAVGQELAIGPSSTVAQSAAGIVYDIDTNTLTRTTRLLGGHGFKLGQQVTIGPLAGTWTVVDVNATVLTLNGPQLDPFPNATFVVKAVSQYVGIVKAVTATTITLNLALQVADFPSGPNFVTTGCTAAPGCTRDVKALNRVGNSAPFFVFPLANPYLYSGNDVIDAHLLDWSGPTTTLRPIGLTIYGGPGNDLIIGSQTGDQLAGGSGDDTIMGQRGTDIIYGDSGFNVDLITRLLSVAVAGTGPAGYLPAKFVDKDGLTAGNDLLYGEGPGSAPAAATNTVGNDDDIIFGDLGIVTQDVSGARDVTKPVDPKPQAISTTSISDQFSQLRDKMGAPLPGGPVWVSQGVKNVDSAALQNGGNDWIYGNADRDLLVGGTGNDAIDGGIENDLILGDNASLLRTYHDTRSARFQMLCGGLLYSRSDEINPCTGTAPTADVSGALLVNGIAQPYRDPIDTPWWAEYDVTQLYHDFTSDDGLQVGGQLRQRLPRGRRRQRRHPRSARQRHVAGRRLDRLRLAGQPGHGVRRHPGRAARRRVPHDARLHGCRRHEPGLRPDRRTRHVRLGRARASDGEDYIEGNAGNDVIFGNLGQDDLVGGSSDFFSLTTVGLRPNGGSYDPATGAPFPGGPATSAATSSSAGQAPRSASTTSSAASTRTAPRRAGSPTARRASTCTAATPTRSWATTATSSASSGSSAPVAAATSAAAPISTARTASPTTTSIARARSTTARACAG